jgi:uncharacterized protein YbjT (DUF2867 family)
MTEPTTPKDSNQPHAPRAGAAPGGEVPASRRPSRRRRVVLTGATGFIGRHVLAALLEQRYQVVAVARSQPKALLARGVIHVVADIGGEAWQRWCEGCSAVIHLVGIIKEAPARGVTFDRVHRVATERVVAACRELGIPRLVHMSALGARPDAPTAYHRTKAQAEELVRQSGLRWTIFRPSVVFGKGDGFTTALIAALRRFPVFPIFGDGSYRLQPIAVTEVAAALVASLGEKRSEGKVVELGGPEALTYSELLRRTAAAIGRRPLTPHLPLGMSRLLVRLLERFPGSPITTDQLTMLLAGSTCDTTLSRELFGIPVARFEPPF